jgi:dihydrofolate reductase
MKFRATPDRTAMDPDLMSLTQHEKEAEMRRIVVEQSLSLDGVAEDPGRVGDYEHRGWMVPYWNDDIAKWHTDQLLASDALLLGRQTYEEFVAIWPRRRPDEAREGLRAGDPFAERMNSIPKFVASTTLEEPLEWNSSLLEGDLADEVADLKQQPGRDILIYGSGTVVNALLPRNLIDEYRFMIYPLVLGRGKRLLRGGHHKKTLALKHSETSSTGVTMLVLEPQA